MPAGNPKGQGPSEEARARSAASRRRQAEERLAGRLRLAGWLVVPPEGAEALAGADDRRRDE
jgi:hypothetical protein